MSPHRKMQTSFPFSRVFVLGIIFFFFGLASMVISVVAFVTQSWGHYVGTGMWGGAVILMSGMAAVFASRLKSLISIKTFCLCSTAAVVSSLAMLILSAGGLTLSSGFYSRLDSPDYSKRTSNLIHASLLVIAVFCLSGNVLAVIVCCKYLFFEHYIRSKHHRRHRPHHREGTSRSTNLLRGGGPNTVTVRASTDSRTPLQCSEPSLRRHSDHVDINLVPMEYRRAHRRSTSDQHVIHTRRHRQCSSHGQLRLNVLSPETAAVSLRYNQDKRRSHNKRSGLQMSQEIKESSKERERLNIEPLTLRQMSIPTRPASNNLLHSCLPHTGSSGFPQIRLPTDFDEEELPPYEPMAASQLEGDCNFANVDSGDESDTENSSSTEAHSYDADASCLDGGNNRTETVRMVDLNERTLLGNNRSYHTDLHSNQDQVTSFILPPSNSSILSSSPLMQNGSKVSIMATDTHSIPLTVNGEEVNLISMSANNAENSSDMIGPNHCVLRFAVSHQNDPSGDYERLMAVSPEICAINGESPSPISAEERMLHEVNENFYENSPCYENCQHVGQASKLNQLSTPSVPSPKNTSNSLEPKGATGGSSPHPVSSSCTGSACVLSQISSQASISSPTSLHSNISSSFSAFKPVCSSSITFPQSTRVLISPTATTAQTPPVPCISPAVNETIEDNQQTPTLESLALLSQKYKEQGAKPKSHKCKGNISSADKQKSNMSWKNIPLPFSYNHTDCATCNSEEKLPSKFIPFTNSLKNISISPSANNEQLCRSPSSDLFQSQTCSNGECSVTSFNTVAQSILSPSLLSTQPLLESSAANTSRFNPLQSARSPFSCLQEAKDDINCHVSSSQFALNIKRSRSSFDRRREEHINLPLSNEDTPRSKAHQSSGTQTNWKPSLAIGTVALQSTRLGPRPHTTFSSVKTGDQSSLSNKPRSVSQAHQRVMQPSNINGGISVEVGRAARPLSLIPFLTNSSTQATSSSPLQAQSSNFLTRQNPLIQQYPLQPQQPRLGVQLHQRRQQQHQLQQNIESQQQQQQRQQEQQQQDRNLEDQGQQLNSQLLGQNPQPPPPQQRHGHPPRVQAVNIQNLNDRQQLRNGRPLFSVLL